MTLITDIPHCPDSIKTIDARSLFMELCQEKIYQRRLTPEMVEAIKGYVFIVQASDLTMKLITKQGIAIGNEPNPLLELETMFTERICEYSELIGLTPLDRKNLGI